MKTFTSVPLYSIILYSHFCINDKVQRVLSLCTNLSSALLEGFLQTTWILLVYLSIIYTAAWKNSNLVRIIMVSVHTSWVRIEALFLSWIHPAWEATSRVEDAFFCLAGYQGDLKILSIIAKLGYKVLQSPVGCFPSELEELSAAWT